MQKVSRGKSEQWFLRMKLRFFLNGFCRKQGRAFLMGGLPLRAKKSPEEQKNNAFLTEEGEGEGGCLAVATMVCASLLPSTVPLLLLVSLYLPLLLRLSMGKKELCTPPLGGPLLLAFGPLTEKNTHFPYPYPPKGGALENSKPLPPSIYVIVSQNILRPHLITQ